MNPKQHKIMCPDFAGILLKIFHLQTNSPEQLENIHPEKNYRVLTELLSVLEFIRLIVSEIPPGKMS